MTEKKELRELVSPLQEVLLESRRTAMTAVNAEMLRAYWEMGKILLEAREGENVPDDLLEAVSAELAPEFGRAFSAKKLAAIRSFYGEYAHRPPLIRFPEKNELAESGLPPLNPRLSWTHYRLLLSLPGEEERKAAERMTLRERWSVSELERQLGNGTPLVCPDTGEECDDGPSYPEDFASDPHVQAFLGVPERQRLTETVLERALIDHLQTFFLEKGQDLYLVERQRETVLTEKRFSPTSSSTPGPFMPFSRRNWCTAIFPVRMNNGWSVSSGRSGRTAWWRMRRRILRRGFSSR